MQRELTGETFEFCDEFGVSSDSEIGLNAGAESPHLQFPKARDLGARERLLAEFDERHSAPQCECVGERCRGSVRCSGQHVTGLLNQALETVQIKLFRVELQQVTRLAVDQRG